MFTGNTEVAIFTGTDSPGGDIRSMVEALRPVSGPAGLTEPLPAPAKDVLDTIAKKCGAAPEADGEPVGD